MSATETPPVAAPATPAAAPIPAGSPTGDKKPASAPAPADPPAAESGDPSFLGGAAANGAAAGKDGAAAKPEAAPAAEGSFLANAAQPPAKLDLKIPKGRDLDASSIDSLSQAAAKLGISQEVGQQLLDTWAPALLARREAIAREVREQLGAELKEVYGDRLPQIEKDCARFFQHHGVTPEAAKFLAGPVGNHPVFVDIVAKAGAALKTTTDPLALGVQQKRELSLDERLVRIVTKEKS